MTAGWFFIPDLPHHRRAWFLSKDEKEHAATRLGVSRRHTWDLTVFQRVLFSWQFWLLPTIFMREFFLLPSSLPGVLLCYIMQD